MAFRWPRNATEGVPYSVTLAAGKLNHAKSGLELSPYFSLQSPATEGRSCPLLSLFCLLVALSVAQSPYSQGAEPPARRVQPDDARLCDVWFVDPQHGWAVGDHGVILHTDDGGLHWTSRSPA